MQNPPSGTQHSTQHHAWALGVGEEGNGFALLGNGEAGMSLSPCCYREHQWGSCLTPLFRVLFEALNQKEVPLHTIFLGRLFHTGLLQVHSIHFRMPQGAAAPKAVSSIPGHREASPPMQLQPIPRDGWRCTCGVCPLPAPCLQGIHVGSWGSGAEHPPHGANRCRAELTREVCPQGAHQTGTGAAHSSICINFIVNASQQESKMLLEETTMEMC